MNNEQPQYCMVITTCASQADAENINVLNFPYRPLLSTEPSQRTTLPRLSTSEVFTDDRQRIAQRNGREDDYVEIALDSEYRYNPLHNNLDSSALAYSVASLLNNLYGRGKEPFWQQAYTNMLQHIILLHKILYDYVTFFDVYECAISPPKLEKRIEEGRYRFEAHEYISVTPEVYGNEKFATVFSEFRFAYDEERGSYKAPITAKLDELLRKHDAGLEYQRVTTDAPPEVDDIKRQQLEVSARYTRIRRAKQSPVSLIVFCRAA